MIKRRLALRARPDEKPSAAPKRWRRGTVALEFALVSLPFLTMIVGFLEIGYNFYVQEMLDYGTQAAARQIQVGTTQSSAANVSGFLQSTMCQSLAGLLPCNGIWVNVQVVNDYWNTPTGLIPAVNGAFNAGALAWCPGNAAQLVLLQTYYPLPTLLTSLLPFTTVLFNNTATHMITSSAAFMNEKFSTVTVPGVGC